MSMARVRALIIVGSLVVIAAVTVIWAILRDSQATPPDPNACGPGEVRASLEIPENFSEVTVNVYNDTDQEGLAQRVSEQLAAAGFVIGEVAQDPLRDRVVRVPVELRFGPEGVGAAYLLSAFVTQADFLDDLSREGATVDFVIGIEFEQLRSQSEVQEAISRLEPSPFAGMC